MARYNSGSNFGVAAGMFCFFWGIYLSVVTALAFWTDRNLEFWLGYMKGEEVVVPFILSWLVSILGPLILLANLIAEILRLVVS